MRETCIGWNPEESNAGAQVILLPSLTGHIFLSCSKLLQHMQNASDQVRPFESQGPSLLQMTGHIETSYNQP